MIAHLLARSFRNLEELSWRPGAGRHLLLGGTGAGKTSVLEAAYLVATTRSFRTYQLADCVRHRPTNGDDDSGASALYLRAEIEGERRARLEVGWSQAEGLWRGVNGGTGSLAEHLEVQPILAWTAADVEVLTGDPELRRRLIDRGVVSLRPASLALLSRYRRTLQHKRRLLAEGQPGLETWNEVLAAAAVELVAVRRRYLDRLQEALDLTFGASGLDYPPVELVYRPSPAETLEGPEATLAALGRRAVRERERRRPLVGPHRDRIEFLWGGRELRRVASAGERKAVGLLVLAAQSRVLEASGRAPVLLVDDADVELDRPTLEALWRVLGAPPQLFASSNRPEVWEELEVTARWQLREGRLEPSEA